MKKIYIFLSTALLLTIALTSTASASVYAFHFTGQYTLLDPTGKFMEQVPIDSTLTYNDNSGSGASLNMSIDNFDTAGHTAYIYELSLKRYSNTDYIVGNMLADYGGTIGIPISMIWNGTGLFSAINDHLQVGDVISGNKLLRNGSIIDNDLHSATPASDGTLYTESGTQVVLNQGPAPLAMTTYNTQIECKPSSLTDSGSCMNNPLSGGMSYVDDGIGGSPMVDGPFPGLNVNFDIGSGHSLTVLSISSVPVPAAAWLFGSGLLGLIAVAKREKTA